MNYTKLSRYLSLILRHKPEVIGITLDRHGWAKVTDLIDGIAKDYPISMEILEEIVRTDSKQRYCFNEAHTLIRANQGHSIPVDVELVQTVPPPFLWHGTGEKSVPAIDKAGLLSGRRLYVHLSSDTETALQVGRRHGRPVLYQVDSGRMAEEGYSFFLSQNGVWLTRQVPVSYLQKCETLY